MKNHIWKKQGFDDFMKGTFGNGGQNLYVSKNGVLQRIHLYDVTGNGYPDMLYANSQSMGERVPMYAYRGSLKCEPKKLRTRGSYDAVMADITGDGTMDLIVACQHDGVHSDVTAMIYYGSPEGYTEKYMAEIYVPSCFSVAAGDFRGIGKRDLAFASESGLRLFEQTNLGIEPTVFRDLPLRAAGLIASDLDGDGYDDLFVTLMDGTCYVYWGGKDGINADRFTALPYTPLPIRNQTTSTAGRVGFALLTWTPAIVDIKGERCFLYIDGDKVSFISFKNRELSVVLSVNVPNATHATVGNLTGGNDIFITVSERDDLTLGESARINGKSAVLDDHYDRNVYDNVCHRIEKRGNSARKNSLLCVRGVGTVKSFYLLIFVIECTDNTDTAEIVARVAGQSVEL